MLVTEHSRTLDIDCPLFSAVEAYFFRCRCLLVGNIDMKQKTDPCVFIAYSWDSDFHKEKVKKLVHNLRLDGINVVYDGDLQFGERIQHFCETSISKSDIVLFICTPKYKDRADNRISGVGYESGIITSELFETCNENKFIPILFDGTWETALPIWAKGKFGIDLSTSERYTANYPNLLMHLQNYSLHERSNESSKSRGTQEKVLEKASSSNTSCIVELKKVWKHFWDISTFRGYVISGVIVSVIAGIIMLYITPLLSHSDHPPDDNSTTIPDADVSKDAILGNSIPDDSSSDITPDDTTLDTTPTDDTSQKDIASSDSAPDDQILDFDESTANGTMPKGTTPISITIAEDTSDKLNAIQKLSIGTSKAWIDDVLGPPFAEKKRAIIDDRLLRPNEDPKDKTGEVLVCAYNISDIVMVQTYFDISDNSCQAFFVTLLDDISDVDITLPEIYSTFVSDKPLGEFAFSEIQDGLMRTYGYAGQGVSRAFYGEEYYFGASGNYNGFFFAVLDYGMLNSVPDFVCFLSVIQFYINGELPLLDAINVQREKFFPNTYGISILSSNLTFDLLSEYSWFDSLPYRGWD